MSECIYIYLQKEKIMSTFGPMSIGSEIKRARIQKGYSQKEMSDLCGFDQRTLSNYESGKVTPSLDRLEKIAEVLDRKWKLSKEVIQRIPVPRNQVEINKPETKEDIKRLLKKSTGKMASIVRTTKHDYLVVENPKEINEKIEDAVISRMPIIKLVQVDLEKKLEDPVIRINISQIVSIE